MNKNFGIFLVVTFLAVQMASFLHMAEHGFDDHEHNGQVCDIYLFSENTNYSDETAKFVLIEPSYKSFDLISFDQVHILSFYSKDSYPRGPPLFS